MPRSVTMVRAQTVRRHGMRVNAWLFQRRDASLRAGKKYPLEQANEAIKASLEAGRSQGKIFLEG